MSLIILCTTLYINYNQAQTFDRHTGPFVQKGDFYFVENSDMAFQKVSVKKDPNDFRVVVLGGSQALGDPYTVSDKSLSLLIAEELGIPIRGGISYWLQKFLGAKLPTKNVQVINMGVGSRGMDEIVELFRGSVDLIKPDLVFLLAGNNERDYRYMTGVSFLLYPEYRPELDNVKGLLHDKYLLHLKMLQKITEKRQIPLILSTVPTNLKSWSPYVAPNLKEAALLLKDQAHSKKEVKDPGLKAINYFYRGQYLLGKGLFQAAYQSFQMAKENDLVSLRCSQKINNSLRNFPTGPLLLKLDLEEIMRQYADSKIPGSDLFMDYVHLKLHGYILAASHLADKILKIENPKAEFKISMEEVKALEKVYWKGIYRRNFRYRNLFKWFRLRVLHFGDDISEENYRHIEKNYQ
ncbi:MAG: hypothetical protein HN509_15035 [Halobacteriovoraceae bacterium]|nr:hypothetical protein [Halobacteriovoraceae bacterium]MBT5093364.1 hypothetical protein [Halobacteriovoraceae bacterium]